MRHILYPILLAALITFPGAVVGITSHFQTYSLRYWHKLQIPFSYVIGVGCTTFVVAVAHLTALIMDLEASAGGFGFRDFVTNVEPAAIILLVPFWIAVVIIVAVKGRMGLIGACISTPPKGHVVELVPQLCTEWAILFGFSFGTLILLGVWFFLLVLRSRDAFVSRIWKRRQRRADGRRGIAAPPAVLPPGFTQIQPIVAAVPAPSLSPAQIPAAHPPTVPPISQPVATPVTIPAAYFPTPTGAAAPPSSLGPDVEHEAAFRSHVPEATSYPMTSPASPPPSTHPSWLQPSNASGSAQK